MFSLLLFGRIQIFSNKELAEKNASYFLFKRIIDISNAQTVASFKEAYQREQYSSCIKIWNEYVKSNMIFGRLYHIYIDPLKIDQECI